MKRTCAPRFRPRSAIRCRSLSTTTLEAEKRKGENSMSQELTTIKPAPLALTLSDEQVAEHQEAFAMNVASGNVSAFDLPRIKVMSGAALWLLPGLENDETAPKIEGVIVYARDTRVYYSKKDAGNVPPDCSSTDNVQGSGKPGGDCAKCS